MKRMHVPFRRSLFVATIALTACAQPDEDAIARELYGAWRTDSPEYAERGFVLTADSVTLHQGGGIRVTYPIERIRRTERPAYTDYVVTYRGVVSSLDFPLEYRAGEIEPDLRFPNQQRVIWKRAPAPTPPAAATPGPTGPTDAADASPTASSPTLK